MIPPQWTDRVVDGHNVRTSPGFIARYGEEKLQELVRQFLGDAPALHEYGRNVYVDDVWEEKIDGDLIVQMKFKNPQGEPTVLIDFKQRLIFHGIIKRSLAEDGQNKYKGWK